MCPMELDKHSKNNTMWEHQTHVQLIFTLQYKGHFSIFLSGWKPELLDIRKFRENLAKIIRSLTTERDKVHT